MSFGHRGFPQFHNPRECRKNGAPMEEFKAPIEVHFVDGVPYPTTLRAKDVPL